MAVCASCEAAHNVFEGPVGVGCALALCLSGDSSSTFHFHVTQYAIMHA